MGNLIKVDFSNKAVVREYRGRRMIIVVEPGSPKQHWINPKNVIKMTADNDKLFIWTVGNLTDTNDICLTFNSYQEVLKTANLISKNS